MAGRRCAHFTDFSQALLRLARIGSCLRNRPRSSASSCAVA